MKKKYVRWILWLAASPFILFIILCVLIYLPPVQNYLVDKSAEYASQKTKMNITVGHVALSFPLNLVMTDVQATSVTKDTLLEVGRLQVNVQLLPLLKKKVEIDGISLKNGYVDSNDIMHGMIMKGRVGELFISSHGIDLDPETAVVDDVLLKNTQLSLCITDTASQDTTSSGPNYWKFILKKVDAQNVSFDYSSPQQNIHANAYINKSAMRNGYIDLHKSIYSLQTMYINKGSVKYNEIVKTAQDSASMKIGGIDPADISLSDINIQLDSLFYKGKDINANLRKMSLKETNSGLNLISMKAKIKSDSKSLNIPKLEINTDDSYLSMKASMDWNALDKDKPGVMTCRMMADIGKPDMLRLMGGADENFVKKYPSMPLRIRAGIDGNTKQLKITSFHALLPDAFDLLMNGEIDDVTSDKDRNGKITLNAKSDDIEFLSSYSGGMVIPSGSSLDGTFLLHGTKVDTDILLKQFNSKIVSNNDSIFENAQLNDSLPGLKDFKVSNAMRATGYYDWEKMRYEADMSANNFDLHRFFPADSMFNFTAEVYAKGEGIDMFAKNTTLTANADIETFVYGKRNLGGLNVDATLLDHNLSVGASLKNSAIDIVAQLKGDVRSKNVVMNLNTDIRKLDWQLLGMSDVRLQSSQQIKVDFSSNMAKNMSIVASMTDNSIIAPKKTFKTKDLFVGLFTTADSTRAYARAGDMDFTIACEDNIEKISKHLDVLTNQLLKQWKEKHIDQEAIKKYLPSGCFRITAGRDNPLFNMLAMKGISFDKLFMDIDSSPVDGLNGTSYMYGLHNDSLALDTIYLDIEQGVEGLKFYGGVTSMPRKYQAAFDASIEGSITTNKAQILLQYLNDKKEQGVYLGVMADLYKHGINLHFFPEHPTIVYRPFNLNTDNYIFLGDKGQMHADVRLRDDNGSGLNFFTNNADSTSNQDMSLEIANIKLSEFRRVLPYMPNMHGLLGGDFHYIKTTEHTTFSGNVQLADFIYEGTALGNWEMSGVYMPGNDNQHHIDGFLMKDDQEVAKVQGLYLQDKDGKGSVNGSLDMEHFPLSVINPFVPEKSLDFRGDIDGILSMKGEASKPIFNGNLTMDSVSMFMPELSALFRFDNRPVTMENSRMVFDNYNIYTKGKNPFVLDGYVDFANIENIKLDLKMHAENYELINSPKTKRSIVYGKMYVDFDARLRGPLEEMNMRGNMNILGKTDFTYIMKDSPLTVNDRLNDMVTFVNFNDSTVTDENLLTPISINGMDIALTMHIDQAVQAKVDITADGSNYMLLEGGGDLAFQYTPQGNMLLNGRYSLISGEMKYQIPVIPLKTFNIQNGSYLDWTGNPMNPTMNITATEQVRASVGESGQSGRIVTFNVGVAMTNQLENPGLQFILSATDDASVQEQLNAMSVEQRGKLAVTMLVTGMYVAEGNTAGGFNVNNTLNAFLQSEISNVVGKTMDINVGLESVDDGESGNKRTDYNFQFAKRFWNNRFRIVIGGTVSTGNTAQQDESFIDNVSIEYRLDNSGTRYVKLFYDKNFDSVLEGEITETGVGVVLRKKMTRLGDLFIFKRKKINVKKEK